MERDFTLKKYKKICQEIIKSNYKTLTVSEYLRCKEEFENSKFIIIRHDIDNKVDLPIARDMAELENSLGIKSTYYFRIVNDVFNKNVILAIHGLNHEIGYHYEVLNESQGDIQKAISFFSNHLDEFRSVVPIETICQHGGSLGEDTASTLKGLLITTWKILTRKMKLESFRSNDIWNHTNMEKFGLLGEAYLSMDFNKILYLSDTGLRWDGYKNRVLDVVDTYYYNEKLIFARTTDDIIILIKDGKYSKMNLLMHPANWIDPLAPWLKWRTLQLFRNIGKRITLK